MSEEKKFWNWKEIRKTALDIFLGGDIITQEDIDMLHRENEKRILKKERKKMYYKINLCSDEKKSLLKNNN